MKRLFCQCQYPTECLVPMVLEGYRHRLLCLRCSEKLTLLSLLLHRQWSGPRLHRRQLSCDHLRRRVFFSPELAPVMVVLSAPISTPTLWSWDEEFPSASVVVCPPLKASAHTIFRDRTRAPRRSVTLLPSASVILSSVSRVTCQDGSFTFTLTVCLSLSSTFAAIFIGDCGFEFIADAYGAFFGIDFDAVCSSLLMNLRWFGCRTVSC